VHVGSMVVFEYYKKNIDRKEFVCRYSTVFSSILFSILLCIMFAF
jgi:hypothetical protein